MRFIPAIIIGVAITLAPIIWFTLSALFPPRTGESGGLAIDSGARIEIEMLSQQVEDLRFEVQELANELSQVAAGARAAADARSSPLIPQSMTPSDDTGTFQRNGTNDIIDAYAQVVLIADRRNVNQGLKIAGPSYLQSTFGSPRQTLSDNCEQMTNERLRGKLVLEEVGPIRVHMLQPAIDSLRTVFENIRLTDPDLYARINTAGALCVRQIRGTRGRASTHAFGLAVDLNIDGVLDTLGDGKTQLGLTILADFFRSEGWVWGAAWGREDSMHFEVSRQKLDQWIAEGKL